MMLTTFSLVEKGGGGGGVASQLTIVLGVVESTDYCDHSYIFSFYYNRVEISKLCE
jgi:hypothetical protein